MLTKRNSEILDGYLSIENLYVKSYSPIEFEASLEELYAKSQATNLIDGIALGLAYKGRLCAIKDKGPDADLLFKAALSICRTNRLEHIRARVFFFMASLEHDRGQINQSWIYLRESIKLAKKHNVIFITCYAHLLQGVIHDRFDQEDIALESFETALKLSQENNYHKLNSDVLFFYSQFYITRNQLHKAEELVKRSQQISKKINYEDGLIRTTLRLATIYLELDKINLIPRILSQFKTTLTVTRGSSRAGTLKMIEGKYYSKLNNNTDAIKCYFEALHIFKTINSIRLQSNAYCHISEILILKKKPIEAVKYSKLAYQLALKTKDGYLVIEALKKLFLSFKQAGNLKKAYYYLDKSNLLSERKLNEKFCQNIDFINLKRQYESSKIFIVEEKKKAEMLRLELEQKERELTEKTRHLIKQTEAVAQFRDDLRAILRRTPGDDPLVKDVKERLKSFPEEQLNWIEFDKLFDSVHPEFYSNIVKAFPKLTIMERKICILLRLKLTSTDISKLMFLSDRNIENHRYRIRKKLGLNTEESIHEFLAKF